VFVLVAIEPWQAEQHAVLRTANFQTRHKMQHLDPARLQFSNRRTDCI
jgi:hypothetical protein